MARARFIRPEFFTDEKVGSLPYGARLLFSGVWCHSDLRGVFEHSARQLRVLVFPFDEGLTSGTVEDWLGQLGTIGMVIRFEADGKAWGYIRRWADYQDISTREVEIGSRRPHPPGWQMPTSWSAIIEKARNAGRLSKDSPWNSSRTVLGLTQNPTPTATPTATPTPTPTPTPTHCAGAGGGISPEGGETDPKLQRAEFCKMLRRLRVADGDTAAERWWTLALDTKAKTFEQRLDAIWWTVTEGKARGIKVRFASDVEVIAMEWQLPKQEAV